MLTTLTDVIDALESRGNRDAIVAFGPDGVTHVHRSDLAGQVDRMASRFRSLGVSHGDRVVMFAPNMVNWVVAALASIRVGAVVAPIDAQASEKPLKHILEDADPRLICTVAGLKDRIRDAGGNMRDVMLLDEESGRASHAAVAKGETPVTTGPDDGAVLFYTSGTTGPPKGVPLTHGNIIHQINVLRDIGLVHGRDRLLLPLPFHHVYPFVMGILLPLAVGAPIILPTGLTGQALTGAARQGRATILVGVPRLYGALIDGVQRQARTSGRIPSLVLRAALTANKAARATIGIPIGRYALRSVGRRIGPKIRLVSSGGAALKPELAGALEAFGWDVATGYGLSETSPLLTLNYPGHSRLATAGNPIPGVELRIDSNVAKEDAAAPSSHGEGEVLARGPNVFAGYRNLPEKTKEAFTSDGWFRTGDLGFLDRRGYLHLTGRVSTMIVTEGGKHVQPDEVEEHYQDHPAIREIGILHKDGRLVALVVPKAAKHSDPSDKTNDSPIRRALEERGRRLRTFERISDFAITHEPLPRTRLGKIQRHELESRFDRAKSGKGRRVKSGPLPESDMSPEDRELLRDPGARAVWEWLAKSAPHAPLTPDSSLRIDLDIDSMEWLNLTLEISRSARVELDDEAIGRVETVRDLLQEIARADKDGPSLEEALESPRKVLSASQRRWLRPLSATQKVFSRALYGLNHALMRLCFRVTAEGVEHLPRTGGCVIAPNHVSYLDPFALAAVLNKERLRKVSWAGWTGAAFRGPITRSVSRLGRAIPIDPERAVISSLALAAAALKRGDNLVWFPEGERSKDGKLHDLRPGIGILLEHQRAQVIPVHIQGTHEALPRGSFLPHPRQIRVRFGEPVSSHELEREGKGEEASQRIVAGLAKRLRGLARMEAEVRAEKGRGPALRDRETRISGGRR